MLGTKYVSERKKISQKLFIHAMYFFIVKFSMIVKYISEYKVR